SSCIRLGETRQRYVSVWSRLVCYVARVTQANVEAEHRLRLSPQQRQLVLALLHEEANASMATLDYRWRLLALSVSFIRTLLTGSADESALVAFMAVLGIDDQQWCLRAPHAYTPWLAGLLHCSRLLGLGHVHRADMERREQRHGGDDDAVA